MELIKYCAAALFLLMVMNQPVSAVSSKCSYSKSVQQGGTAFDISSRPASGCAVQIVTVAVRRGGKKIAGVKVDVDYLAQSAQAVDLTGAGTPDLAIFSRTSGGVVTESLDVYWLDGATLRRLTVPELDEKSGYKGGDRFHLEERMIVRTIPVYRDGDAVGKPTGGTRTLKYKFRDGAFSLYVQTEKPADPSDNPMAQNAALPTLMQPVETKPAVPAAAGLAITGITTTESGIEIKANGAVVKYRTIRLDKPERIAIDIPGADSSLTGKKVVINRFGISKVRVGRNKGFLRVVLDTTRSTFPKYVVKPSETGVLIEFTE